jgi:antagonist of KipI
MSLEVVKSGIADTFQDAGRYGYQHLGVNPNGAMDLVAMKVANALVGNDLNETVLELYFPASTFTFKKSTLIALSGADFTAELNGKQIPINKAIVVPAGSELRFTKIRNGVFCYLAVSGGFEVTPWMNSCSTNAKAKAGGWKGRSLKKGDEVGLRKDFRSVNEVKILPWRANTSDFYLDSDGIRVTHGNEFDWLDEKSKVKFEKESFSITSLRDRMGYRLKGEPLKQIISTELISTAVTFGTVQLLPDGQLIILMADHQTTGGYPRIAQIISADRSRLVQHKVDSQLYFKLISVEDAEDLLLAQHKVIKQIQVTCSARLSEFLTSVS